MIEQPLQYSVKEGNGSVPGGDAQLDSVGTTSDQPASERAPVPRARLSPSFALDYIDAQRG